MEGKRDQFIFTPMINFLQSSTKVTHNIKYSTSVNLNPLC